METARSFFPYTQSIVFEWPLDTAAKVESKLEHADACFKKMSVWTLEDKVGVLKRCATLLRTYKHRLAMTCTLEMGKRLEDSEKEVEKCAAAFDYFADHAQMMLGLEQPHDSPLKNPKVKLMPNGPLLAVMPWNFPFWQVVRAVAPQVLVGQPVVLKHATQVSECSRLLAEVINEASPGCSILHPLFVSSEKISKVIADHRIAAVTLTGSESAGRAVAIEAGKNIKKCVLELGGSDPYLITAHADLKKAAQVCVQSRLINMGQSCIAAKRFIVDKGVAKAFVDLLRENLAEFKFGDPREPRYHLAPLARKEARKELLEMLTESTEQNPQLLIEEFGDAPENDNPYFMNPRLVTHLMGDESVVMEETFGPVFCVVESNGVADMVQKANSTRFGLGAALFSSDEDEILSLQNKIRCGTLAINELVQSHASVPFGGVKSSGIGRELARYGVQEFANIQTVYGS